MDFKANLDEIMKQAKSLQEKMQNTEKELGEKVFAGEAGGGMVKVTMNGRYVVKAIVIASTLIDEGDKEMTEDLVAAAVNDAVQKVKDESRRRVGQLTKDLKLPEDFKLPDAE